MLLLALDTATEKGSLALLAGDSVLGELSLETPGTYLQHLLPGVESLLQGAGRRLEELSAIGVSQCPGNFTGLRIGLATAKALAWALGCPLAAVSTLEVLAAQFPLQSRPVGVVMDAKRSEVYLGLFLCPDHQPQALGDPVRLALADLPGHLQPPLLLTGPGVTSYEEFFTQNLPPDILLAPPEMRYPRAPTLARLARRRLEQGLVTSPQNLVPTYLRPAL